MELQNDLTAVPLAVLPEAEPVVQGQRGGVVRFGGQGDLVGTLVFKIADDRAEGGGAVSFALMACVNHEAPQPVAVGGWGLPVKGKHGKTYHPVIDIDGEGTGDRGMFLRGAQGAFVGGDIFGLLRVFKGSLTYIITVALLVGNRLSPTMN